MKISINRFISARTYKTDLTEGGFVLDERSGVYYLLKGKISFLFEACIKYQDFEKILIKAKEMNMEAELLPFLAELKKKEIIRTDKNFPFEGEKFLSCIIRKNTKQFSVFDDSLEKFLYKNNFLNELSLQLSYKCNLRCKHCFNPKDKDKYEISFENAKKIIDEAYTLGITKVMITGGECSIHKDFLKIINYIRGKHLSLNFLTNAQMLYNDDFFQEVVSLFPHSIQISLYSMNPDTHDYITGIEGSHKKTLHVIKKLRENNINTAIACHQLKFNKYHYKEISKFAASIEAEIKTDCFFIDNKKNNNSHVQPSDKDIEEFYSYKIKETIKNKEKLRNFTKSKLFVCRGGIMNLNISPNLDITPCNDFNYVLGNYNNVSLKDVLNNVVPEFKRRYIRDNLKECFKYEYCRYCDYCPSRAMFDSGFMKKSPALCRHAKIYYNALQKLQQDSICNKT